MSRVRHIVSCKVLKTLYKTLISSYLVYCNVSWGEANIYLLQNMFILQKQAIRICAGSNYRSSSSPLFSKLRLLNLVDIIKFQTAMFMYKIKYNLMLQRCLHFAAVNNTKHSHNTRKFNYFVEVYFCTSIWASSLSVRGPKVWNSLPSDISDTAYLGGFKPNLITVFLPIDCVSSKMFPHVHYSYHFHLFYFWLFIS